MIPQSIQAVIFDVDGLLIDSEPSWQETYLQFLKRYNIVYDPAFSANRRGIGLKDFMTELRKKYEVVDSVKTLLKNYREIFYEIFLTPNKAQLFTGAEELIKALHQKQLPLAIATGGHTRETMKRLLDLFGLTTYFPLIISCDEVHRGKPHPDVFLITAEKLQEKPETCLVLEDSVNGVQAGKAAGMIVYGVNKDKKIQKKLEEAGADAIFSSLEEIIV